VAIHAAVILLGNTLVGAGKHWSLEDYPLDGWLPKLTQPDSAAALVTTLDEMLAQVDELVQQIPADALDKEVTFSWGQQQAADALSAGLVHALTHVGGIAGIRAPGGFPVPPGY
jgi:hypothetical protein